MSNGNHEVKSERAAGSAPETNPGGSPSTTDDVGITDVDVCTMPDASVTSSVTTVGLGDTVGIALALIALGSTNSGE